MPHAALLLSLIFSFKKYLGVSHVFRLIFFVPCYFFMTQISPAVTAAFTTNAGDGITVKIKFLLGDAATFAVSGYKIPF